MSKGFWINAVPETATQAENQFGSDKAASLVKNCIKEYIASFLKSDGVNRKYIPAAFPSMNVYLTDDIKQNVQDDPSKKFLKLSALYERVKETLPCILLDDSSVTFKPSGLGKVQGTTLIDTKTQFWFHSVREVAVSIIIGANDLNTCTNIRDSVAIMLGDLCKFICGNILLQNRSESSSWVVMMNMPNQQDLGSVERVPVGTGESANNLVYFTQGTVTCRFESSFAMEMDATKHTLSQTTWDMELIAPETVNVGSTGYVELKNARPFGLRLFVSNENIAILKQTSSTKFKLLGMKKGTVTLQLMDMKDSGQRIPYSMYSPKIVLEKTITII